MKDNVYRKLIETSPLAYSYIKVIWGEYGTCKSAKLLEINKSFENLFKLKKETIIDKDISHILNDKYHSDLLSVLKNTVNTTRTISKYMPDANLYVNIEVHSYEKDEYHIRYTKLDANYNTLSAILRNSPFITWIKDKEGKYIDVNDKYLDLIGTTYKDVIGKTSKSVWNNKTAKEFDKQDSDVINKNKLCVYEETLELKDSRIASFQTTKWPYTDISGNIVLGTIGISMEITDEIKLMESIEKNEQNFLDLTNHIDQAILIRDEKKVLYLSPHCKVLSQLGVYNRDKGIDELYKFWYEYWDEIEFLEEPKDYNYKEPYTNTFRIVKHGKIDKWITTKCFPVFDENGNLLKKIMMANDITDKKKLEDELENLRLEFFANLSHELRTPINLIMSSLQVIYPRVCKLDEENQEYLKKYLNILSQNNLRLLKLVNNLIDSTKINSNHFAYNPTNQDIVEFVEDICTSVVDFIEHSNMEIIFDTDTEEQIVAFDLDHLERILLNLISNAIKFNRDNGKIEINICTKDNIVISVKDEGIGIPKDKLDTVFGRFEQVDKNMKREREGSGIGLSLVKSLVEMHNGEIHLHSTVGEGSEFSIILPNVLVPNNTTDSCKALQSLNKINKMEVEFSDIYL